MTAWALATTIAGTPVDTATITAVLVGVVIPFLVDLVTKDVANPKFKAAIATGLAALSGALSTVVFDPSVGWKSYLWNVLVAFTTTMTVHRTGVSDLVQRRTKRFGIAGPRPRGTAHAGTRPPGVSSSKGRKAPARARRKAST